jgi:glyoxylate reductase
MTDPPSAAPRRVLFTRRWPGDAADRLRADGFSVDVQAEPRTLAEAELAARAAGAFALVTTVEDAVTAAVLEATPSLRIVAQAGAGYDNVDLGAARARGVWVTNAPGVLTEATADLAFALLLAVARRLPEAERQVREGRWTGWHPDGLLGLELAGATVGVVGLGRIGAAFARRCEGFGTNVLYWSRAPRPEAEARGWRFAALDDLLARADAVSLHVSLTPDTRGLLDRRRLGLMKPGALLVNTARGGVVDQDALVDALRSGRIGGAGLDVTEPEPLPPDHPLLACPNTLVTPHIASATEPTRARLAAVAADNVRAVAEGRRPPNAVAGPAA